MHAEKLAKAVLLYVFNIAFTDSRLVEGLKEVEEGFCRLVCLEPVPVVIDRTPVRDTGARQLYYAPLFYSMVQ